jgi:hypothetical protein
MSIDHSPYYPDDLAKPVDLLERFQLFGAEEDSLSCSLLSSSTVSRKRKITEEFSNLDTVPRPSSTFQSHQPDLRNRKISLENPDFSCNNRDITQQFESSSSIQREAVPLPLTNYIPPTNGRTNETVENVPVVRGLEFINGLRKRIRDQIFPTALPTALPVNFSAAPLPGPSVFSIQEQESNLFKEPRSVQELISNSPCEPVKDDGLAILRTSKICLPPTNDRALNEALDGLTVNRALEFVELLQRILDQTVLPTALPVNFSPVPLPGPSVFLLPSEELYSSEESTVFHELTPNSTRKHDEDDGKSPILEGSPLFNKILEEADQCGNMARIYRNYKGRLLFRQSAFERRVNNLRSARSKNFEFTQLAIESAKEGSLSPILEGSSLFQDILKEAISRKRNIKATHEKYKGQLKMGYTTFAWRVRRFKSELAQNFESVQLAGESASEMNRKL